MPVRLRVVRETGVCSFCWRTLPLEDLRESDTAAFVTGHGLLCKDDEACCDEFRRWDYGGRWREHPQYGRLARAV